MIKLRLITKASPQKNKKLPTGNHTLKLSQRNLTYFFYNPHDSDLASGLGRFCKRFNKNSIILKKICIMIGAN